MTGYERWQCFFRGEQADRIMVWPKLFGNGYAYSQSGAFATMSRVDIYKYWDCDFMEYLSASSVAPVVDGMTLEILPTDKGIRLAIAKNQKVLELEMHFDLASQSYHPAGHPLKSEQDVLFLADFFRCLRFTKNDEGVAKQKCEMEAINRRGIGSEMLGESPLMAFVEYFAGIEEGHILLAEYPDETEELFGAMQQMYKQRFEVMAEHSLADVFVMTENTSSTIISPGQFRQYCVGHLNEYYTWLRGCGKPMMVHMCGKLRHFLPDLHACNFEVLEAVTSSPIGDISLCEVRRALPNKRIVGGGNAVLFTQTPQHICSQVEETFADLQDFGGIVYSTGGIIPPTCAPETVKQVVEYIHHYR